MRGEFELDDDLGLLHLVAELLDDATLDLVEIEACHPNDADHGDLDRAVLGHALDAEIGALPLDGREDIAAVAFVDAYPERLPAATVRRCAGDSELVVVTGLSGVGGYGRRRPSSV